MVASTRLPGGTMRKLICGVTFLIFCLLPIIACGSDLSREAAQVQIKKAMTSIVQTASVKEGDFQLYGFGWETYESLASMGYIKTGVIDYCFYRSELLSTIRPFIIQTSDVKTFSQGLGHAIDQRYTENKILLWKVKYQRITGIKKINSGWSGCGAQVIFTCKVEKSPFVGAFANGYRVPDDVISLAACFTQYDDGWRMENVDIPNWVGSYDNSMKTVDNASNKTKSDKKVKQINQTNSIIHKGKILKVVSSAGYSYIKYQEGGKNKWMATMETPVKTGDVITFSDSPPMKKFVSKSLGLVFDEIIFAPSILSKKVGDSVDYDFATKNIDQILNLIDNKFKKKIIKACGNNENCVAVISNAGVESANSIKEAISAAGDGDVIWIGAGDYNGTFDINNRKNIVIVGNNSNIITEKDEGIINISECSNVTLYGMHVVHKIGESCSHNCINVHNSQNIRIIGNDIDGSGYMGIFSLWCQNLEISKNTIHHCTHGIIAHSDQQSTIRLVDNKFYDNKESNTEESDGNIFQEGYEANNEIGDIKSTEEEDSNGSDQQENAEESSTDADDAPSAR
jgi:hypothetical protein